MAASMTVPPEYAAFVDDAALLPPRDAALADAVAEHRAAREGPYADLVGPFVVDDRRLPQLLDLPAATRDAPFDVVVAVGGGAGAVEPAVRWAAGGPVRLCGVEVALRDLDDLTGNARRVAAAVRAAQDRAPEVTTYVEVPLTHVPDPAASRDWLTALDEVADADLRLALRTGGLDTLAVPGPHALASAIDAALDRELAFTCTGGPHHAVRRRASDTGAEQHGFLNILLATAATWDGGAREDVAALLDEHDAAALATATRTAGVSLTSARRWFTSFGCSRVADTLDDLLTLGLLGRVP